MRNHIHPSCLAALLILAALLPASLCAEWNDSIRYRGEINATLSSGDHTPFWLMSNRHGVSSLTRNNGYLRLGAFHDIDTTRRFSWGAGVDLVLASRFTSTFFVQQLYGEVAYRCLDAMVGSKEFRPEINNPELSSGNLLYSGNAHPVPQVRVGIFDYADFWGCRGWFSVKGYVAYGKFTDSGWVEDWTNKDYKYTTGTLYHSKAIYLKGGDKRKFPLEFELGFESATEFGGTLWKDGKPTKMPQGFKDWIKALIPMKGGSDTPVADQTNVEGNVLGSWNFCLSWNPKADWRIKLYYEHYFEDHSMMTFDYPWKDGLYGVEAKLPKNPVISEIVYEFLYTKDQSGAVYWDHTPEINEQVSGRDNYYNHYFYNGWQNWGMGIGTPFIISPIYNFNHEMIFRDNRVVAHHVGFRGDPLPELGYLVKASYSRNWGRYGEPFKNVENNYNLLIQLDYRPRRLAGWEGKLAFAMDRGGLLGRNYGVMLNISKTGWLFAPKKNKK